MGVLIREKDMPACCDECFALDDNGDYPYCLISQDQRGYNFNTRVGRMPSCPLVEVPTPHGRLIDADAYAQEIRERREAASEWYKEATDDEILARAESALITFTECSLTLKKMQTIIKAEGDGYGE